ncbi:MAG: hypothetical protein ABIL44_08050 [candidate division WOR-3 bacterium]
MSKVRIRMVVVVMCILPIMMYGAKVGVLHLKSVGVSPETAEAVAGLLANELSSLGHRVLNTDAMDGAAGEVIQCYEAGCAAEVGFKAQVERVIFGSVSRFGEKYMVQVSVVNVSTREVVWSGSLAAKSAEDLDTVVKRIAKAIHEGKKVETGAEVGLITEQEETQEGKRKEAFYATGANFVYGLPVHGYADASSVIGFNWVNWYETSKFAIEFNGGYIWSLNAMTTGQITEEPSIVDYGANISFFYLFSKGDFCPYAGVGLGPRFIAMEAGNQGFGANFGMGFNLGGGLVVLRTYDFHIIIDGRYAINTANIPNYTGPHGALLLSIGVIYKPKHKHGCGSGCMGGCF